MKKQGCSDKCILKRLKGLAGFGSKFEGACRQLELGLHALKHGIQRRNNWGKSNYEASIKSNKANKYLYVLDAVWF